jgi:hypothetical protein
VCVLPVAVTDDPGGARAFADKAFSIYNDLPSYRAMLDIEGGRRGRATWPSWGTRTRSASRSRALATMGVTDFVAARSPPGDDAERTRALLSSLARARPPADGLTAAADRVPGAAPAASGGGRRPRARHRPAPRRPPLVEQPLARRWPPPRGAERGEERARLAWTDVRLGVGRRSTAA